MICVVLASGAAFGTAAQTLLQYLGLDFASIHNDLIAGHAVKARSAIAWWCWCLVVPAAFFVGPLSAALTRDVIANWWRLPALRLCVFAAAVLGLAAIGQLRPAHSTLAFGSDALLDFAVVIAAALLAALGALVRGSLSANAVPGPVRVPNRTFAPLSAARPWRGGGSAVAGLPFLRFRERHRLAPGPFSLRRLALVAALAGMVFAVVSALGGATVLLDSLAPRAVRALATSWLPPAGDDSRARTVVLALLPVERPTRVVMPPVALLDLPPPVALPDLPPVVLLDLPPPKPVEPAEPRQRAITASVGYAGPALSESDLTFTKGYTRRRAAQLAINMTSLPSIPQLTAAINIEKIRAASLRFTQERRLNRPAAYSQHVADNRRSADNRHRVSRNAGGYDRYGDRQARYGDYYNGYSYDRYSRHDRRRAYDRYGGDGFARAEPAYRRF